MFLRLSLGHALFLGNPRHLGKKHRYYSEEKENTAIIPLSVEAGVTLSAIKVLLYYTGAHIGRAELLV
jgi:hypothetical protein|nr:MAG TPA: hypothetical protein [Caudoviricetes sp.]